MGAVPGDNVGFNIKGLSIKQIARGNVASDAEKAPAAPVRRFLAQVIILITSRSSPATPRFWIATPHTLRASSTLCCPSLMPVPVRSQPTCHQPSRLVTPPWLRLPRPSPCAWRPTVISHRLAASPCATCVTPLLSASSRRLSSRIVLLSQLARQRRDCPSSPPKTIKNGLEFTHETDLRIAFSAVLQVLICNSKKNA